MFFLRSFLVFIPFCVCVGRANQVTHSRQLNSVDLKQTPRSFVLDQCINNLWSYFFRFYSHLYTTTSTCWTSYKRTAWRSPLLQVQEATETTSVWEWRLLRRPLFLSLFASASVHSPQKNFLSFQVLPAHVRHFVSLVTCSCEIKKKERRFAGNHA